MPTRQGFLAIAAGVAAIVVGRVFGILELFVIGAAMLVAVGVGVAYTGLRLPRIATRRWVHPSMLAAGDTGTVDLDLVHGGSVPSAKFLLEETIRRPVDGTQVAPLAVEALRAGARVKTGYDLTTSTRGIIEIGPLVAIITDPLGVSQRRRTVAGVDQVIVAPRSYLLPMPTLGTGPLGQQLLAQARRLGPGEFHSLREYVDGDEPRSIHWKASARSEDLLVKQHTLEGLRRALIVLDIDPSSYVDRASFERAITVAASLVASSHHAELATRFVTGGGIDLRGPDVAPHTLDVLARIEPDVAGLPVLDRDPGEGIGLGLLVTGRAGTSGWNAVRSIIDPTMTVVPVTTDVAPRSRLAASARTEEEFVRSWRSLAGPRSRNRMSA